MSAYRITMIVVGALLAGLVAATGSLLHTNHSLQGEVTALQALKQINRLQEGEIEAMAAQAQATQEQLGNLERLGQQIHQLTDQAIPAGPSRGGGQAAPARARARGGPESAIERVVISPSAIAASGGALSKAADTKAFMDGQLADMTRLRASLTDGKAAIAERLEYLAHRPSGLAVSNPVFTDRFGWRWSPFGNGRQHHEGLDLAQDYGTPITATGAGVVTYAGWRAGGYGNTVIVDHGYGFQTMYAHMTACDVAVDQQVRRGTQLGWLGSTGESTGPHLHYEVHVDGVPVDPANYLE